MDGRADAAVAKKSKGLTCALRIGTGHTVASEVQSVEQGFIRISSAVAVADGIPASLEINGSSVATEIQYCRRVDDSFVIGLNVVRHATVQGRREVRFPLRLQARFCVLGDGQSKMHSALLLDVSQSGVGFACSFSLKLADQILMETDGGVVFGTVRYSRQLGDGQFRVGIQIDESLDRRLELQLVQKTSTWRKLARAALMKAADLFEQRH